MVLSLISKNGVLHFDYKRNHHLQGKAIVCLQSGQIQISTVDVIDVQAGAPYPEKNFSLTVKNASTVTFMGQDLVAD